MPKLKMTSRGVAAISPPASGQVDYWDDSVTGFGLRVSAGGKKSWVYMYRLKDSGQKRRYSIGAYPGLGLADARDEAVQLAARVARGEDPVKEKNDCRRAGTFSELADLYLEEWAKGPAFTEWEKNGKVGLPPKPRKKSWFKDERIINFDLAPALGSRKAYSVDEEDVEDILDGIVNRGAPIQANRSLEILRGIYNWALKKKKYKREFKLLMNPCFGVRKPSEEVQRDRVLTEGEIKKIWIAAGEDESRNAAVLKLELMTAQRGGEVLSMHWDYIDLAKKWWGIPAEMSKNGIAHRVPLSDEAVALLTTLQVDKPDEEWVFPKKGGGGYAPHIQKVMDRVRNKTNVKNVRQHDLRRTAASHLASLKVPRLTIAKILNHVDPDITAVYDRYSYDAEKKEALDIWGEKLASIISSEGAGSNVIMFDQTGSAGE